jgi:hypothetical protein
MKAEGSRLRGLRLCVVSLLVSSIVMAGVPAAAGDGPVWRREPGGRLAGVTVSRGGHIYATGSITGKRGDALMVAKYRASGHLVWRRTWRHPGRLWHAQGLSIAPAPGGGVYAGGFTGYGTGEGGDALVMRYSAGGRILWRREIGQEHGTAIVVALAASPHGVVAAVEDHGCCDIAVEREGFLQAFRADGTPSWSNEFEAPGIPAVTRDTAWSVAIGSGGRLYAAGSIDRRVYRQDAPPPDVDRIVQALNPRGRVLWTRVTGFDRIRRHWDDVSDVAARGAFVVATGTSWPRRGSRTRAWVGAFDADGRRRWSDGWGGGRTQRFATEVSIAPWGPFYVGTESSLRRYGRTGGLVWERPIPGGTWVSDVAAVGAVYVVTGSELQRWRR